MSGVGGEGDLPFAFARSSTSEPLQDDSHVGFSRPREVPESQLESQRLDIIDDMESSEEEEAPNDLMIEMPLMRPQSSSQGAEHQYRPQRAGNLGRNFLGPRPATESVGRALFGGGQPRTGSPGAPRVVPPAEAHAALKKKTLQMWAELENLDEFLGRLFRIFLEMPQLIQIKEFYEYLLEVKEADMDTVTWREVVQKIARIKNIPNSNPHGKLGLDRLDPHSIANRIMRRENYMIAIFNKDILDLTLPFLGKRQMLTKIIEWNLSFCILSYVFDENGSVRKRFLKNGHRVRLIAGYAEEYSKNPSSLGARQYSPFAWWKFREFNELPNLYQERLNRSYAKASRYMEQFPKEKTIILARFISFIAGSFAAVLAVLTLVDNQLLEFEITPQRSVFFYIGVFGGISAVARAMIPAENQVFEPERVLKEVIEETHYLPDSWRGRLHTEEVKNEFATLFDYKIVIFFQEILSVLFTPIVLYYSLPKCSAAVIDFFREYTVHEDSLGYVCSFAVFNFRQNGNQRYGAPSESPNNNLVSKEGKMEQSFLFFKANNPDWEPDHQGSQYLQTISRAQRSFYGRPDVSASMDNVQSLLRPRRFVKFGPQHHNVRQVTESMLSQSEVGEEEPIGIIGLLDAIYSQRGGGLALSAKGSACVQLIQDVLNAPGIHVFAELLETPNIAEIANNQQLHAHYELLRLFAFGTYSDYKASSSKLPPLTPAQLRKLKHLSIVTLSGRLRTLPYSQLMEYLDISNVRELEDLIIDAIYQDIIKGKLDQKKRCLEVEYAMGRDLQPGQAGEILKTLVAWSKTSEQLLKAIDAQLSYIGEESARHAKEKEEHEKLVEGLKKEVKASGPTRGDFEFDPRREQFHGFYEDEGSRRSGKR
ncbi:autophagy protein atg9 [Irineochytrium annulatum]|nr:autophagy protein atg9 [Irineochytrium annulatum]